MPLLAKRKLNQDDFDVDIISQDLRGLKIGSTETIAFIVFSVITFVVNLLSHTQHN